MAENKKTITKSVSLEATDEIVEFVKKQKNFSRTIRILILKAIYESGGYITDIAEAYEKAMQAQAFEKLHHIVEEERASYGKKKENPSAASKPTSRKSTDIPEGY